MSEETAGFKGGGTKAENSWAQRLGGSLPSQLQRNVLEIGLEKDQRGIFIVSDEDCARLMEKIGLTSVPKEQIETVQICPNGKGVIYITLKDGIQLDRFCKQDVFTVTQSGIRSTFIKPASKKEVIVTIRGIHPNTRDSVVIDYLAKFGTILTTKVMYGSFLSGPLEGLKNGNRSYKLQLKPGMNIGSYHYLDGQKVTLRYAGQKQTCGRCHEDSPNCPGRGVARECEQKGGSKVAFSQYVIDLWNKIGYSPPVDTSDIDSADEQIVEEFTPVKVLPTDDSIYAGISIRKFSKDIDHGEIMDLLIANGLPENNKDDIHFKDNGVVSIFNLENATCKGLKNALNIIIFSGRRLTCNGIVPMSPAKVVQPEVSLNVETSNTQDLSIDKPQLSQSKTFESSSFVSAREVFESSYKDYLTAQDPGTLARRHSISLINRTPPKHSLAAELLDSPSARPSLQKTKSVINELKDLTDRLSEFGSCISSPDTSVSDNADEENDSHIKSKNQKKKKRKHKVTPYKDSFLKKPNLQQK